MADAAPTAAVLSDPLSSLQASLKGVVAEWEGLEERRKALKTEVDGLTLIRSSLSEEITDLRLQAAIARQTLEEEQKAAEWWRKKEEASLAISSSGPGRVLKRTGSDISGRLARTAWLADEQRRMLQERLDGVLEDYGAAMEGERSIAAGLRDRIGRMEARSREQQDIIADLLRKQGCAGDAMREREEGYERQLGQSRAELADLREALAVEKQLRDQKQQELDKITEGLRNASDEMRKLKATAAVKSPPRALGTIQQNILRPQTPPRSLQAILAKSPVPSVKTGIQPTTPRSLARAYAYLDRRHTEAQEHIRLLQEQVRSAQAAIKDVHEQHRADLTKFREWKKVESERSAVRKRKREEKRKERGEAAPPSNSTASTVSEEAPDRKKRRSEVMVEASDESAPPPGLAGPHPVAAGYKPGLEEQARTSQTAQDGDVNGTQAGPEAPRATQEDREKDGEEEEQSYRSAPDAGLGPRSASVLAPHPVNGRTQRPDEQRHASEDRGSDPVQHDIRQSLSDSEVPLQVAKVQPRRNAADLQEDDVRSMRRSSRHMPDEGQVLQNNPKLMQPVGVPGAHAESSRLSSGASPHSASVRAPSISPNQPARLRRSTSPTKQPNTAHTPIRTTPWLGGGNLVRTSSKQSISTTVDPFDLSPPEAGVAGPSRPRKAPHTVTPQTKVQTPLVRDRGETSLRRTALTRFPSERSVYEDSPRPAGKGLPETLDLEGLTPAEKARRLKKLNNLSASEKREVYKGYKREGRYLAVDQVKRPVQEEYEIDPAKNEGRTHAFHDVKRKKEDRRCMHGGDCEECQDWYSAIGDLPRYNQGPQWRDDSTNSTSEAGEGIRRHQNMVSRHRDTWARPATPPGYWSIKFPTTQDVEEQNRRADEMEREKEQRIIKEAGASNSKWRKRG